MRPFKFFFMISIGIILFFAIAKIVFFAFIAAAILSIIYMAFRGIFNLFKNMDWEHAEKSRYYPSEFEKFELRNSPIFNGESNPLAPWEKEKLITIR